MKFKKSICKLHGNKTFMIFFVGILLIIVQLVFAFYTLITTTITKKENFDIWLVVLFRVLLAVPTTLFMALFFEGKFSLWNIDKKCMFYFMFFGLTSVALNPIMYIKVVVLTTGSFVTILSQLIPIFSSVFSILLRLEQVPSIKEKSTIVRVCGIIFGVLFAIAISSISIYTEQNSVKKKQIKTYQYIYGTTLGIFNNLVFSFYLVLQTKLIFSNPSNPLCKKPFTVNFLCSFYGSFGYIIIFIIYSIYIKFNFEFPIKIWIPSVYSGILITSFGFGILTYCIKHSSAMISSCLFSMQIATTLIILTFLGNEKLETSQYILTPFLLSCGLMVILSPLLKKQIETKNF